MTKTKKGFLKAGAILGIIIAALVGVWGMICFAGQSIVTRDLVVQTYLECEKNEYTPIENFDGSITYKVVKDGQIKEISSADADALVSMTKAIITAMGIYSVALAIASVVISILVLINACTDKCKYGYVITLLILSLLSFNLITAAFMIVVLCLKNKQKQEPVVAVE